MGADGMPNRTLLELVVAVAENEVIGRGNGLPWRLPADLKHFKALTLGKPVLMGRRTYQSIGKALPGRTNIVLTRSRDFSPGDALIAPDMDSARAAGAGAPALMVIGGAEVYAQCLALAARIHLTLVHTRIEDGDAFFAGWRGREWRESHRARREPDADNALAMTFLTLDRVTA